MWREFSKLPTGDEPKFSRGQVFLKAHNGYCVVWSKRRCFARSKRNGEKEARKMNNITKQLNISAAVGQQPQLLKPNYRNGAITRKARRIMPTFSNYLRLDVIERIKGRQIGGKGNRHNPMLTGITKRRNLNRPPT